MNAADEQALMESEGQTSALTGRRTLLYILPIVLLPILLLSLAFFIVPTRWFMLHSGNDYMANIGYGETLVDSDCKVLVYGDSSALTGVDALRIGRGTGLKTCNIAEFEGMTAINETLPVDHYLAHNPAPRFIVFVYAPDNLRVPRDWSTVSSFEAITYRVGHGHDLATALLLLHHIPETLGWAEQGMRMSMLRFHSRTLDASKFNERQPFNGEFHVPGVPQTGCDLNVKHEDPADLKWLAHLRSYNRAGTTVIVDATPAPPCDRALPYYQRTLPALVDDIPYPVYPVGFFVEGTKLHVTPQGSALLSDMIADQINSRLKSSPDRKSSVSVSKDAPRPALVAANEGRR